MSTQETPNSTILVYQAADAEQPGSKTVTYTVLILPVDEETAFMGLEKVAGVVGLTRVEYVEVTGATTELKMGGLIEAAVALDIATLTDVAEVEVDKAFTGGTKIEEDDTIAFTGVAEEDDGIEGAETI